MPILHNMVEEIPISTMAQNIPLASLPSTSFTTQQVNRTTFLIIEDDSYNEQPHIYVKIYPSHLLITDTGCNSPRLPHLSITSLRQYLEIYPIPQNNNQPLNSSGKKEYIILCTHCHYDHILGLNTFISNPKTQPTIIASSHSKYFLLSENLYKNSLCKYLPTPVPVPTYTINHWATHLSSLSLPNNQSPPTPPFRIQFLHLPGHTPDSLAWYDIDEQHLYIGDTFYERRRSIPIPGIPEDQDDEMTGAIQFPNEGGNWVDYMNSLDLLLAFTRYKNKELQRRYEQTDPPPLNHNHNHSTRNASPRVKVSTGHITTGADAEEMIKEVKRLFERVIAGKVPARGSLLKMGAVYDFWMEKDDRDGKEGRYSVLAPRRLLGEARKHLYPRKEDK